MNSASRTKKIAVIAGDGIGPEIINQIIKVIDVLNQFGQTILILTKLPYSAEHYLKTRVSIPDEFIAELGKNYDALLLGPLGDPRIPDGRHAREIISGIRNQLDLFLSYQRIKVYDPWMSPLKNAAETATNFLIVRENIESSAPKPGGSLYRGTENEIVTQSFFYTQRVIDRFFQSAFELVRRNGSKKIVLAHKNTIMTHLHELWLRDFQGKATQYPEISTEPIHIDALLFDLLSEPQKYEVIAAPAEIADVICNAGLFLQGGYGLAHVCEINPGKFGAFRITQSAAVKMTGHNRANPFGGLLATLEMLRFLDLNEMANIVDNSIAQTLQKHLVTIDMGGLIGTEEVGNYVCEFIQEQFKRIQTP